MAINRKIWEDNWIAEKAGSTVSLQMIWKKVLENTTNIPTAQLNPILRAVKEPSSARAIVDVINRCEQPSHSIEILFEANSHFSPPLEDWLEAIEVFIKWCDSNGKHPNLSHCVNYVACCAEWLENKVDGGSLSDVTDEMLTKYGWDGNTDQCTYN